MGRKARLRTITAPFVVAAPTGARIRTRLHPSTPDETVLRQIGRYLGSLYRADLAARVRLGDVPAKDAERTRRKRELTAATTSRWAGSITRTSEDQYQLAMRALRAGVANTGQAIATLDARIAAPVGGRHGRVKGYTSRAERASKQQRRAALAAGMAAAHTRLDAGRPAIVAGGKRLANTRHHLDEAQLTPQQWRDRWDATRMFLTADGESGAPHGNYTISVSPDGVVTIALPAQLKHLANAARSRYVLSCLATLSDDRLLGIDLNADHLAAHVVDIHGNPVGAPITVPLDLAGPASQRDGRLRAAITEILRLARTHGCPAIAIENLGFIDARATGRETMGRGRRGKTFRRTVAGIPTARFRERLTAMAYTAGLAVVAVDPAYTSRWGGQHWKPALTHKTSTATRHHAASVVIARRAHGFKARRRPGVTRTRPADRARETTGQAAPQAVGAWEQPGLFETARATPVDKTRPRSTSTRRSLASKTVREAPGPSRDQHAGQLWPTR